MANMEGAERVVGHIVYTLRTYLGDELNAQDAAWKDSDTARWGAGNEIVLDDVQSASYFRTLWLPPQTLPAVAVVGQGWRGGEGESLATVEDVAHEVPVYLLLGRETDPDRGVSRVWRTLWAIRRVLMERITDADGDGVRPIWDRRIEGVRYGELPSPWEPNSYLWGGSVTGTYTERVNAPW